MLTTATYPFLQPFLRTLLLLLGAVSLIHCQSDKPYSLEETADSLRISTSEYVLSIQKAGFRFQFSHPDGKVIAPFHSKSGLMIGAEGEEVGNITSTRILTASEQFVELEGKTEQGIVLSIRLYPNPHQLKFEVLPTREGDYRFIARTGALGPAYGMGDHAARGEGGESLVLEHFVRDPLGGDNGSQRMISNFVIFPQQGFAEVCMEPSSRKIIRITDQENAQGADGVPSMPALYYFVGTAKEIYKSYLEARNEEGFPVYKPKHEWFGVGWEAFGALAWNTNHETVRQNIDQYLSYGYPLSSWMVVGSGFWPRGLEEFDEHGTPYRAKEREEAAKKLEATTSFGMWDNNLYPDPKGFIDSFHKRGLIFTIGLRIGFIPGGPFTEEGLQGGHFLKNQAGDAELFKVGFPRVPVYLLDSNEPDAVSWYVGLCKKWTDYGVDGFKEDLFHWPEQLQDDLIDPVNRALMDQEVYIMGRNNYLGSPADIHRYDDFNYNQLQDRGPINGLAYAFSGFPYVYPDIIGGTGLATGRFGKEPVDKLRTYIVRYAQYASLNPSMAFGFGPWNFDDETNRLCLAAAQLHYRLKPHIFSNAIKAYHTGFPYPMTPLPLAYPDDPNVYGLADTLHRQYQWMIGESLLAAPLYGNDYPTAFSRNIYLPAGTWIDYESGKQYEGPGTLKNFNIPINKTPLFVGGTGFLVEQEKDGLIGRLYPIQIQSHIIFWHTDGETKSEISIEVNNWEELTITDESSGTEMESKKVRHAWQFEFEPGHNYSIR